MRPNPEGGNSVRAARRNPIIWINWKAACYTCVGIEHVHRAAHEFADEDGIALALVDHAYRLEPAGAAAAAAEPGLKRAGRVEVENRHPVIPNHRLHHTHSKRHGGGNSSAIGPRDTHYRHRAPPSPLPTSDLVFFLGRHRYL